MYEQHAIWFALREGSYEALKPDANGALHSEIFPGLNLQPSAIWDGNMAALLAALQEGLASPAHKDFVTYLGTIKG